MNKNIWLLTGSNIFGFTAANVTVFLSGIIGSQISPIKTLSTLPPSIYVIGIAISTIFAAIIMRLICRRWLLLTVPNQIPRRSWYRLV